MGTSRKRTAKKKTTSKAAAKPVVPSAGERLWVLDVPYMARQAASWAGATWDGARRTFVYCGVSLPAMLEPFRPEDLSWAAWQASEVEKQPWADLPGDGTVTLRPHQRHAADLLKANFDVGMPGMLLADEVGLGKTYSTVVGVNSLPASVRNVLVVCPLSVVAAWRKSLRTYGTGQKRWCVTNYDSLKKLVDVPASATQAKKTRTKNRRIAEQGRPLVSWDVVIFDESHSLRNPTSQRTKVSRTLADDAFVVWASATAGQNPLELSYLAPLLGIVTGDAVNDLNEFEQWCARQGVGVSRGAYGKWQWDGCEVDLDLFRRLLFEPSSGAQTPVGIRRRPDDIAGWPSQHRILHPVGLTAEQRMDYDKAWTQFRKDLKLAARGKDPTNGMVARTRFRQKASLLRAEGTVELVESLLANGRQVAISCVWLESCDAIEGLLHGRGVDVARIDGSMSAQQREQHRERYQRGSAPVIVFTVKEGINLHSSEQGANGVPRVTVVHDARYDGISMLQVEGRSQRDGTRADVYYCYGDRTVEEQVIGPAVRRVRSLKQMQGDNVDAVRDMEAELDRIALASDDGG